jgi:hypothetical protein
MALPEAFRETGRWKKFFREANTCHSPLALSTHCIGMGGEMGRFPSSTLKFLIYIVIIGITGGGGGIRTHDTLLAYTHFPGVRLRPLGHPSGTN